MAYKSNRNAVNYALKAVKHEFCIGVGVLGVAEIQAIAPVNKDKNAPTRGNLKKSIASQVMHGDKGVYLGVTDAAPYGLYVEKGIGQPEQPYLEPGCTNAIPKITKVAEKLYKAKFGGK